MTIVKQSEYNGGVVVDLTGPGGNAYALIGLARQFSKLMGLDRSQVTKEMQAGDYDHLVKVFDHYFGDIVTLIQGDD